MPRPPLAPLILVLSALLASAASAASAPGDREEFRMIGWSTGCSAAVEHYRYSELGQGLRAEPSAGRVGVIGPIRRGRPAERWALERSDQLAWDFEASAEAAAQLRRLGHDAPGFEETIRETRAGDPEAEVLLRSSAGFELRGAAWLPGRLWRVHYSPSGGCALLVFKGPRGTLDWRLAGTREDLRRSRAEAHLRNESYLFQNRDDLHGALEEASAAARMAPDWAEARLRHAERLALHGRFDESLVELEEAVRLDRGCALKAKSSPSFEELRGSRRFKALTEDEPPELWP